MIMICALSSAHSTLFPCLCRNCVISVPCFHIVLHSHTACATFLPFPVLMWPIFVIPMSHTPQIAPLDKQVHRSDHSQSPMLPIIVMCIPARPAAQCHQSPALCCPSAPHFAPTANAPLLPIYACGRGWIHVACVLHSPGPIGLIPVLLAAASAVTVQRDCRFCGLEEVALLHPHAYSSAAARAPICMTTLFHMQGDPIDVQEAGAALGLAAPAAANVVNREWRGVVIVLGSPPHDRTWLRARVFKVCCRVVPEIKLRACSTRPPRTCR